MKIDKVWLWGLLVSGGGIGFMPKAPGTFGAALAMFPALLILRFLPHPWLWLTGLIILLAVLGVIGSNKLIRSKNHDPQWIVIDEMVGMWISILWTGLNWGVLLLSFVLFRFFDITKPFGIKRVERFHGGYGIMADDILAGIYTNVIIQGFIMIC